MGFVGEACFFLGGILASRLTIVGALSEMVVTMNSRR